MCSSVNFEESGTSLLLNLMSYVWVYAHSTTPSQEVYWPLQLKGFYLPGSLNLHHMSLAHGKLSALSIKTVIRPNVRNINRKYTRTLLHCRQSHNKFFVCFNVS